MSAAVADRDTTSTGRMNGIVVGFDGSPSAFVALDWAANAAAAHHLPLTVLTARPDAQADVMPLQQAQEVIESELAAELTMAEKRIAQAHPDIEVSTLIHPGSPVEGLLEASQTAVALVIGSRGLGGFQGLLIGSTAMNVTPYASCPVIVLYVPDEATEAAIEFSRHPDEVVAGFDGSPHAERALRFALRHAQAAGLGVVVVYVDRGPTDTIPFPVSPDSPDLAEHVRTDLGSAVRISGKFPDVPVRYLYAAGSPAGVLIHEAAGCRLAVVGARGRGGFAQLLLGSVGLQMLIHAECPVAIVRDLTDD